MTLPRNYLKIRIRDSYAADASDEELPSEVADISVQRPRVSNGHEFQVWETEWAALRY